MIRTLALLCLVAAPAFGIWEKALKVKFGMNPFTLGKNSLIEMPLTVDDAQEKKWEQIPTENYEAHPGYELLQLWCPPKDRSVCLFFESGHVAGIQLSFDLEKFTDGIYDWQAIGYKLWKDPKTDKQYQGIRAYFVSAAWLKKSHDYRLMYRSKDFIIQDDLYVSGFDGEILRIPCNIKELKTNSVFTKQACIIGMGNHYYYNMTESMPCDEKHFMPFFPLEYNDQCVGFGIGQPGKLALEEGETDWHEHPKSSEIKMIVPTGPECYSELGNNPGMLTTHFYVIKHPLRMTCLF